MDIMFESLEKLGEAIYIHKALIERANKAEKAVDYLAEKGVLSDTNDKNNKSRD